MDGGEWRISVLVDAQIISVGGAGAGYIYSPKSFSFTYVHTESI